MDPPPLLSPGERKPSRLERLSFCRRCLSRMGAGAMGVTLVRTFDGVRSCACGVDNTTTLVRCHISRECARKPQPGHGLAVGGKSHPWLACVAGLVSLLRRINKEREGGGGGYCSPLGILSVPLARRGRFPPPDQTNVYSGVGSPADVAKIMLKGEDGPASPTS